jgi:hypothetical protein
VKEKNWKLDVEPAGGLFVAIGTLLFALFYSGKGNALFMRLFYGTGEHAPHIVNSKDGLLSNGQHIPPFLDLLRLAINIVPFFAVFFGLAMLVIWTERRRRRQR